MILQHRSLLRLQPKMFHRSKSQRNPRSNVSKMSQPNLMSKIAEAFEREFGAPPPKVYATEKWDILPDTMHRTALATFGENTVKIYDWFEGKSTEMNKQRRVLQTSIGHSSVRIYRQPPQQGKSGECTMRLRRHWVLPRTNLPPQIR